MIEKLQNIPLFKVFSKEELETLSGSIVTEEYNEGDVIFKEGDAGTSMYIIAEGEIEIKKEEKVLTKFKDGSIFGEMALYEESDRSASAIAASKAIVYKIDNKDFKEFLFSHMESGINFLYENIHETSRRLRRTSEYLITVFETGKIVGGSYGLDEMTSMILKRILEDIHDATGGMLLLMNPFTDMFDLASEIDMKNISFEKAVEIVKEGENNEISLNIDGTIALCVPLKDQEKILGYILLEKTESNKPFSSDEEVIVSAVGTQVGLGILNAYNKQEEEARKRLERSRMKGY